MADELIQSNLRGVGKSKITKLDESVVEELFEKLCVSSMDDGEAPQPSRQEKERQILAAKERRLRDNKKPPSDRIELPHEGTREVFEDEEGFVEITVLKEGEAPPSPSIKKQHSLRICSLNSLKMRTAKAGTVEGWTMLAQALASFDVVAFQEVPTRRNSPDYEKSRSVFLNLLNHVAQPAVFSLVCSDPSGPGNPEEHHLYVRTPIEVLEFKTHFSACGVQLDHAPLTVKFRDPRFSSETDQYWVLTSVHFPPQARRQQRDTQLKAFFQEYERNPDFRCGSKLMEKRATENDEPFAHHVVAGDFNVFLGEEFGLSTMGFAEPELGEHVSTSAGGSSLDNFVCSRETRRRFTFGAQVLELAHSIESCTDGQASRVAGISDHHPICLRISDTQTSKKKKKKADETEGVLV